MSEPPVVDASPLIHLSRTGNIDLLKSLGLTIVVPESVYDEVRAKASDESARVIQEIGLPLIGTLGIVLRAKHRGLIPHARPIVERMIANGMYLSPSVVQKSLALVGE